MAYKFQSPMAEMVFCGCVSSVILVWSEVGQLVSPDSDGRVAALHHKE